MTNGVKDKLLAGVGTLLTAAVIGAWGYVVNVRADVNDLKTSKEVTITKLNEIAKDIDELKVDVKAIREDRAVATDPGVSDRIARMENAVLRMQCVTVGGNNPRSPFCRELR